MHLAGLVESLDHVCCRYRLRAFESLLRDAGCDLTLHSLPRGFWQRFAIGRDVGAADAVVLQAKLLSRIELGLLRRRSRRLLFDFDDAVWLRDSYSAKGFASSRRLRRFRALVEQCDAIVAGNSFLAEQAHECSNERPVAIIPTCVDTDRYSLAKHETKSIQMVWIGSSSTLKGLAAISPMLELAGRAVSGIALKIICDRFLTIPNLRVVECPWSKSTESSELTASDIGISWIPDDPWSRGKCGLKVLQYMAAGLPVVANPVGVQLEMVRHGETGFLARSEAEWVEAVRTLAADPELRRRMGRVGRALVEAKYSVAAGAVQWRILLNSWERQRIPA